MKPSAIPFSIVKSKKSALCLLCLSLFCCSQNEYAERVLNKSGVELTKVVITYVDQSRVTTFENLPDGVEFIKHLNKGHPTGEVEVYISTGENLSIIRFLTVDKSGFSDDVYTEITYEISENLEVRYYYLRR